MIDIFFDGLCAPTNPGGVATYGFFVVKNSEIIKQSKGVVGEGKGMTNNVAEYTGLLKAVDYVVNAYPGESEINIYGDSQLAISQMQGSYKVRSGTAKTFVPIIKKKLEGKKVTFIWVRREENAMADFLTKEALPEA